MIGRVISFFAVFFVCVGATASTGAQKSRATTVQTNVSPARAAGRDVKRNTTSTSVTSSGATARTRSAIPRTNTSVSRALPGSRAGGVVSRSAARQNTVVSSGTRAQNNAARAAALTGAVRSAVSNSNASRSSTRGARNVVSAVSASRAGSSRATAVFSDVSKIGGGYAECRDAYATCMDQLCAAANDTYRRCFCSSRFTDFRDTELALDQAKTMLMSFEDNNLAAVNMTADEVNAMYSATVGEMAIKKDTSAAAKVLEEIGDLLSGNKKADRNSLTSSSLGILDVDIFSDVDNVWGGASNTDQDLSKLEGEELYAQANKQCIELAAASCENDAVFTMARSSYNILISQDCNAYEKRINASREGVMQTVRQAEQYLREARLEEYRSHNSADVNECLDKVRTALLQDTACGANYKRCLDYSGAYINQSTGEPIFSPRLFELQNQISLNGNADVLKQNREFDNFLDTRKMFATTALDSCRDIADTVWTEFKRAALIEISQAQDEKIEEVKNSCVSTMTECYDTQSNGLKNFDTTTAQASGAIAASAARAMCSDRVIACASLYGDTDGCSFDGNGKLVSGNSGSANNRCGLSQLLAFVDSVDKATISENCAAGLETFAQDLCAPAAGDTAHVWPWGCRLRSESKIEKAIQNYAVQHCPSLDGVLFEDWGELKDDTGMSSVVTVVEKQMNNIKLGLQSALRDECYNLSDGSGVWDTTGYTATDDNILTINRQWLSNVFGGVDLNLLNEFGIFGYTLEMENGSGGVVSFTPTNTERSALRARATSAPVPVPFVNKPNSNSGIFKTKDLLGTFNQSKPKLSKGSELMTALSSNPTSNTLTGNNQQNEEDTETQNGEGNSQFEQDISRSVGWGVCVARTLRQICESQNLLPGFKNTATYNAGSKTCELSDNWYQSKCEQINGYWEGDKCYVKP